MSVDASIYQRRRDLLCRGLSEAGYEFNVPEGAFYLFPKSPIPDDVKFVNLLQEELILAIPGIGFGAPGYFRLSYAVSDSTIERSAAGFRRALEKVR
jgi:aspartate aminotransferase